MATPLMINTGAAQDTHHREINPVIYYAVIVAALMLLFWQFAVVPIKMEVPATTLTYKVQPAIQEVDIKRVPVTRDSKTTSPAPPVRR